jgi:polysaccharide pyruvyl transferase WcaK-like protein
VIHHVFANRSNAGDWLAAAGIQALLGVPVREHLCDAPFVAETRAALERAAGGDVVIVGAGGLFMDYFDPLWSALDEVCAHLRVVLWGAGVVDLKQEVSLPAAGPVRRVAERADICVVRDAITAAFLGRGEVVPCPSVARVFEHPRGGGGLLHSANYTTVGAPAYDRMRAAGLEYARANGCVHRETANQVERGDLHGLERVLGLYAMSDLVLSSRLHGCLIGLATGRPVLAVSGDRKVDAFMEDAGLGPWVLQWDDLGALEERLGSLPEQPSAEAFVARARRANAAVAARVLELAS